MFTAARKLIQRARDASDPSVQQRKRLERAMEQASSYEEWSVAATKLDQVEGISPEEKKARWKRETKLYDRRLLEERLRHLSAVRKGGRVSEMMFAVRADLLRNLGNMANRCGNTVYFMLMADGGWIDQFWSEEAKNIVFDSMAITSHAFSASRARSVRGIQWCQYRAPYNPELWPWPWEASLSLSPDSFAI